MIIAKASDLREAMKQSRETVNGTTAIIRAHTRVISYDDKIERLTKNVGSKVNGILNAFDRLNKAVAKRVGNTQLMATTIITPEVIEDILRPYNEYLESMGGAKSIKGALEFMEAKREKELNSYGKTDALKEKINRFFDLQRDKYLMPLRVIESQINEMNSHLGYKDAKRITYVNKASKQVIKIEAPAEVIEATDAPTQMI